MDNPGCSCQLDADPFMTVAEFAALPAEAHHAVWQAVRGRGGDRIDTIPAGGILRYHREQVRGLLAELAVSR